MTRLGVGRLHQPLEFIHLAGPDEEDADLAGAGSAKGADDLRASRGRQQTEFLALIRLGRMPDVQMNKNRSLTPLGPLEDQRRANRDGSRLARLGEKNFAQVFPGSGRSLSLAGSLTLRAGTTVEMACL